MKKFVLMSVEECKIKEPLFFSTHEAAHTEMVRQYEASIADAEDEGGYNDESAYCVNSNHDNVNWRICESDTAKPEFPCYKVSGPRDSEKDGWFDHALRQTARIELMTSKGDIIADVGGDSDYPELYICYRERGKTFEQSIACIGTSEYNGFPGEAPEKGVSVLIWADSSNPDGDATDMLSQMPLCLQLESGVKILIAAPYIPMPEGRGFTALSIIYFFFWRCHYDKK